VRPDDPEHAAAPSGAKLAPPMRTLFVYFVLIALLLPTAWRVIAELHRRDP
jgi:hypothetical protein